MEFNFEKLEVWQKSKEFCKLLFKVTNQFPSDEKFVLSSQIKRASLSIPSNIAEGSSRYTAKDKKHFYTMAYSSLMEVINQTIIAKELNYIDKSELDKIKNEGLIIAKMLSKLKKNTK